MRKQFQQWYGRIISQQLADGICEGVDLQLSRMKPILAIWAIKMSEYFTSHPGIIVNGFSAARILDVLL